MVEQLIALVGGSANGHTNGHGNGHAKPRRQVGNQQGSKALGHHQPFKALATSPKSYGKPQGQSKEVNAEQVIPLDDDDLGDF